MNRKLFGTDGVRGRANQYPMTAEVALRLGMAAAEVFKTGKSKHTIVIGKDTRLSGYVFEYALVSGICSMGVDVLLVGPMPTPAIAHLTKSFAADAGIVISASHNPAHDNGVKFFGKDGFKLSDEIEEKIEQIFFSDEVKRDHIKPDGFGKAFRIDDASGRYIEFAKASIGNISLKGLKIVLDCANGAAYKTAPPIFEELGAEVIVLHDNPNGLNINENCGALYPDIIREAVKKHNADIGIALDGDADRVTLVDELGYDVDGDHILALCATAFKAKNLLHNNEVIGTVMSNIGLEFYLKKQGISLIRAAVGDRYVADEMRKRNTMLGGEQSGHIIFHDYCTTGDGTITALQVLRIMKESKKHLHELSALYVASPQVLINIQVREKRDFLAIPRLAEAIRNAEQQLNGKGRVLVRYSGTENIARVMVESQDEKQTNLYAQKISECIKQELGVLND